MHMWRDKAAGMRIAKQVEPTETPIVLRPSRGPCNEDTSMGSHPGQVGRRYPFVMAWFRRAMSERERHLLLLL